MQRTRETAVPATPEANIPTMPTRPTRPTRPTTPDTAIIDDIATPARDSGYEDSDRASSTESVPPEAYEFPEHCGRTYARESHRYLYPNDAIEMETLDMQHAVFRYVLKGKLYLAKISDTPQGILDIGTGTGVWAIDVAELHPSAIITGTDLSATQPNLVPPNCFFRVEDAEDIWTFRMPFDFIHARYLRMSVEERQFFAQAHNHLHPGGWLEIAEMILPLRCDDGSWDRTDLKSWCDNMVKAYELHGTPADNPFHYRQWLEEAGFINIQEVIHDIELNPKYGKFKRLGAIQNSTLLHGLHGLGLKMYTEVLKWSEEAYEVHLTRVRRDLTNPNIRTSYRSIRVIGQKPGIQLPSWPDNHVPLTSSSATPSVMTISPPLLDPSISQVSRDERATAGSIITSTVGAKMSDIPTGSLPVTPWTAQGLQSEAVQAERLVAQRCSVQGTEKDHVYAAPIDSSKPSGSDDRAESVKGGRRPVRPNAFLDGLLSM